MKKILSLIAILLSIGVIASQAYENAKLAANLDEKKAELEKSIALLEQPVVFSTGKDTFVVIRAFNGFNGALLSINDGCPVEAWNYSRQNFSGIFRLPEDINSSDKVIIFTKEETLSDGKNKMFPIEISLEDVELTRFYCKNVRHEEDAKGLPTRNKQANLKWENDTEYIFPNYSGGCENCHRFN